MSNNISLRDRYVNLLKGHSLEHHTRRDGTPFPIEQCPIYIGFHENRRVHIDDDIFWKKDGTPTGFTILAGKKDSFKRLKSRLGGNMIPKEDLASPYSRLFRV